MNFSNSDLIVLFVLGKKDKLSGTKIYEESKKIVNYECSGRRPEHIAAIFRSIQKLLKQRYLKKAGEKRVRGATEIFYSLSEKGLSVYPKVRENILVWEFVPDFSDLKCDKCKDVEDCWEDRRDELEAVVKHVFRRPHAAFETAALKALFKDVGKLMEFIFWLNMLTAPRKILTERFMPQIRAVGLEQEGVLHDLT